MKQTLCFIAIILTLFSCGNSSEKLSSGHPYYHLVNNEGATPKEGDIVEYHFVQRNKDVVIYSTYGEGIAKKIRIPKIEEGKNQMNGIAPLTEAMMLMSEGDSLVLEVLSEFLPPQLDGRTDGESMFFDIKMMKITSAADILKKEGELLEKGRRISKEMKKLSKQYRAGELKDLEELEGIRYKIQKKGSGRQVQNGDAVLVHFSGHVLATGEPYLESYSRKKTYQLKVGSGRVIEAWEQLLPKCATGDELYMFVPYQKAYGVAGNKTLGIPEKSDLAIYMEVVGFKGQGK